MRTFITLICFTIAFNAWSDEQESAPQNDNRQDNQHSEHTQSSNESSEEMDAMKVWGTRVQATSVNMDESYLTLRQADHLSDLLRRIPGVEVGGAHSLNQRINIRGLDDRDLNVTIDGAVQNTYMYHHAGNLQIHADILKAVELEVGTNSVITGGLGGAARFETKDAKDLLFYGQQFGGRIQGSWADNDYTAGALSLYGQWNNRLDFLFYYNHVDRDNYKVGGGQITGADGEVINETGVVKGLAGTTKDALFKVGYDINVNHRLELSLEDYQDAGDYSYRPDMGLATDEAIADSLGLPLVYPTEFNRQTVTLNHDLFWGQQNTLKTTLYYNDSDLWRDEQGIADVFPDSPVIVEGRAINRGLNILGQSSLQSNVDHALTYGFEFNNYRTRYANEGVRVSGEALDRWAVYIQDRIQLGHGFSVIPGARYDNSDVDSMVVSDRFDDVSFALALEQQLGPHWSFKLSGTELFKAPELSEVFVGAGLGDTPNPGIQAEGGINYQLGVNYDSGQWLHAGVTFYRTEIDNYIEEYSDDNIGDAVMDGFESYIGVNRGAFHAVLSYAKQDSEISAFAGYESFEGARLDRTIGDNINLALDYLWVDKNIKFSWNSRWVNDLEARYDLDYLSNPKSDYDVHDISAQWQPQNQLRGLMITLGIDNVFDEHYASHASRTGNSVHPRFGPLHLTDYEPGRNIKATVSYQF